MTSNKEIKALIKNISKEKDKVKAKQDVKKIFKELQKLDVCDNIKRLIAKKLEE